jgi:hypothetical protein
VRGIGLLATVAVTIYLARLARHAIETRTRIEGAARFVPALQDWLDAGHRPSIRWLDYDWRLNRQQNKGTR